MPAKTVELRGTIIRETIPLTTNPYLKNLFMNNVQIEIVPASHILLASCECPPTKASLFHMSVVTCCCLGKQCQHLINLCTCRHNSSWQIRDQPTFKLSRDRSAPPEKPSGPSNLFFLNHHLIPNRPAALTTATQCLLAWLSHSFNPPS
jgi:hypothetical protein